MLILTRQIEETLCIGDDIEVTVVEIREGRVRLGVTAPRTVVVDRKELAVAKKVEAATGRRTTPRQILDLDARQKREAGLTAKPLKTARMLEDDLPRPAVSLSPSPNARPQR